MTNWDNEIDAVARGMTAGEPDNALKPRVLARLDDPRRIWRSPWILSPIAVAAVAIVAVLVMRGPEKASAPQQPTVARADIPVAPEPVRLKADPTTQATDVATRAAVGSAFRRTVQTQAVATVARNDDMDSLAPPLLEIAPIGADAMETMESIEIARLEVAPLDVPAIGGQ